MTTDARVFAGSTAILVGVSAYADEEFRPIPAARNSVQAMRALLSDPALCGWPPERIRVIPDPVSASDLGTEVADLAERTTGILLLYYVGHGVLTARSKLCLTATSTRPDRPEFTGLAWDTLADTLRGCPARVCMVILDCCFAGQAIEALSSDSGPGLADIAHVDGVYTLTATTRNRTAHVPPPGQQDTACTSFTGELRDLIRSGIPGKPPLLTLGDIYPVLRQRLLAKGLPAPNQRGVGTVTLFPFTANAAARVDAPGQAAARAGRTPARAAGAQAGRLIDKAIRIAHLTSAEHVKAFILEQAVEVLATADLDRAERVAQSITGQNWRKASALSRVAAALAATDPDRAERLAQSITSEDSKASALGAVAAALAVADPDRAERLALSITEEEDRAIALSRIAEVLAVADPDRAERIAQSMADEEARSWALGRVALVLAAADPERGERLAWSITDEFNKSWALGQVALVLAATDPDQAARLMGDAVRFAQSITDELRRPFALGVVAEALAATDPAQASRLTLSIADEEGRAFAVGRVAPVLAVADPDRAEHLALSITGEGQTLTCEGWKASALRQVAEAVAVADPDRAERLALSITGEDSKVFALGRIARMLAATDPDRAERIAWSITGGATADDTWSILGERAKAWALGGVARTIAATDPDRAAGLIADAERLAESITKESGQASAFLDAASAFYAEPGPDDAPPGDRASIVVIPTVNTPVPVQDAGRP